MTLTQLTTALHRWADQHGGKFPDAMLCSEAQHKTWSREAGERWQHLVGDDSDDDILTHFKGVRIFPFLTPDDTRVLFACEPSE